MSFPIFNIVKTVNGVKYPSVFDDVLAMTVTEDGLIYGTQTVNIPRNDHTMVACVTKGVNTGQYKTFCRLGGVSGILGGSSILGSNNNNIWIGGWGLTYNFVPNTSFTAGVRGTYAKKWYPLKNTIYGFDRNNTTPGFQIYNGYKMLDYNPVSVIIENTSSLIEMHAAAIWNRYLSNDDVYAAMDYFKSRWPNT